MEANKKVKSFVKRVLKCTPFNVASMGAYIRGLYFWKYLRKIPIEKFEKILDAGCGAGDCAKNLAIKYFKKKLMLMILKNTKLGIKNKKMLILSKKICLN